MCLAVASALLASFASPAAAETACEEHGGFSCGLTAQYSGIWEAERVEVQPKRVLTQKIKLSWSEYYDGQYWVLTSDGGTFSCNATGEFAEGSCKGKTNAKRSSCSGTLSLAAGAAAAYRQGQVEHYGLAGVGGFGYIPFISHNDPSNVQPFSAGVWYLSVAPPLQSTILLVASNRYEEFLHSSETEPGSPCASNAEERTLDSPWTVQYGPWASGLGGTDCHYEGGEVGIDWVSFPAGGSYTSLDNCSGSGSEAGGERPWKASLQQSITFSSPGVVSPGSTGRPGGGTAHPEYGPQFPTAKREALRDMREEAIPNAARYCIPAAGGLGLAGAGVLTSALGPGGGILAVAGSLTAATLAPFCDATIKRLVKDYKTFNDPPLASIHVLARPAASHPAGLPSCRSAPKRASSFCKSLRAAETKLLVAAGRSAAVAAAIEATVSRERAAYGVSDASAIAAQDTNLRTLEGERATANAAERGAGVAVARILKRARIAFRISKKQSGKAIARAERGAGSQGITPANLAAVNSAALKPAPANLLADLERL